MSRVLLSVLVVVTLLASLWCPSAASCPNGATESEITTPGLIDGVVVPESGSLIQLPADTLTLWPISLTLLPAIHGNITEFVVALGQCEATTGCKHGKLQLGLYHFHVVGTFDPNEAGKLHLISYSNPIEYNPYKGSTNTRAQYKTAKAHAQKPSQQLVPDPDGNPFTGYFIGIIGTVPFGVYTGGFSFLPFYLSKELDPARPGKLVPANPELTSFSTTLTSTEAALGFFYCPDQ
jgi:hypothetical protein